MKGYRQQPRQLSATLHVCNEYVNDYLAITKTLVSKEEYKKLKNKLKNSINVASKKLNAKNLSGFKSYIIELTKLGTLKGK